jgi:hypothetical protein
MTEMATVLPGGGVVAGLHTRRGECRPGHCHRTGDSYAGVAKQFNPLGEFCLLTALEKSSLWLASCGVRLKPVGKHALGA